MSISFDESEYLGWAYINGLLMYNRINSDIYESAFQLLTGKSFSPENLPIKPADLESARFRISLIPEDLLHKYILSSCIVSHEVTHIRQVSSSTACLRLTLNYILLLKHLSFSLSSMSIEQEENIYQPLRQYLAEIATNSQSENIKHFKNEYYAFLTDYQLLTGNTVIPLKELINIDCNEQKCEYSTNLDLNIPSSPVNLNLTHLIEAEACLQQYNVINTWRYAGAPEIVLKKVDEDLHEPNYTKALIYFYSQIATRGDLSEYQVGVLYKLSLHLALFPQIFFPANTKAEIQKWEDVQPCWRFYQIIERLKEMPMPSDPFKEYFSIVDDICIYYGWKSPSSQAKLVLSVETKKMAHRIERELLERHIDYCKIMTNPDERWRLIFASFEDPHLAMRFEPWLKHDDHSLGFYSLKVEEERDKIFFLCLTLFVFEDLLHYPNFNQSWNIFKKGHQHFLDSGELQEKELRNNFNDMIMSITGYSVDHIIPLK